MIDVHCILVILFCKRNFRKGSYYFHAISYLIDQNFSSSFNYVTFRQLVNPVPRWIWKKKLLLCNFWRSTTFIQPGRIIDHNEKSQLYLYLSDQYFFFYKTLIIQWSLGLVMELFVWGLYVNTIMIDVHCILVNLLFKRNCRKTLLFR